MVRGEVDKGFPEPCPSYRCRRCTQDVFVEASDLSGAGRLAMSSAKQGLRTVETLRAATRQTLFLL